jgi:hypothetical protein
MWWYVIKLGRYDMFGTRLWRRYLMHLCGDTKAYLQISYSSMIFTLIRGPFGEPSTYEPV